MKRNLLFLLCIGISSLSAQIADNMLLLSNYDDNALPSKSGGLSYNDVWGYANDEGEYAIMGTLEGTMFIDVTDPTNPVLIDHIPGGYTNSLWRDYKTYKNYAYGVADETSNKGKSGLQVFDLSKMPNQVELVHDDHTYFQRSHNIFIDVSNARIYLPGTDTRNNGLIVMDLSRNPAKPELLSSVALPGGYVHDVYVRDNIAYCSHGFNGLYVYDFTNPKVPVLLGNLPSYPNQGYNHSSWLTDNGDFLVFADESHDRPMRVLDVSDPTNMGIVSTFKSTLLAPAVTTSIAHNPFIRDDLAFVSYYHDGVQVYDVSDPLFPNRVGYYDTEPGNTNYGGYKGCWGVYPFLPSGNILASDEAHGLFVLRLDNWVPNGNKLAETPGLQTAAPNLIPQGTAQRLGLTSFSAYPNPVARTGTIWTQFLGTQERAVQVRIMDAVGREVFRQERQEVAGHTQWEFNLPDLPPGTYWLEVGKHQRSQILVY